MVMKRSAAALTSVLVGVLAAGCGNNSKGDLLPSPDPVLVQVNDRYPNTTARDWATYADHVVAVTVVDEQADPVPADAESDAILDRTLTLRVDRVLWSRAEPPPTQKVRSTLTWPALGWELKDGERGSPLAVEDAPRLEVGEPYVMAIRWEPEQCPPGDEKIPGSWVGLGAGGALPYHGQILGNGELAGEPVTGEEANAAADPAGPDYSFADSMIGKKAGDLVTELKSTQPGKPEQFGSYDDPCA